MDFASLLEQHKSSRETVDQPPVVSGLMGALSSSRDGNDGPRHGNGRPRRGRRGRGRGRYNNHHRNNFRYNPQQPEGDGVVNELPDGSISFEATWGKYPIWKTQWLSDQPGNISVTFEARGEDNIVIALSSILGVQDPMYEIVLGGWKNTKSIIRTATQGSERAVSTQRRVCSAGEFLPYWVRLRDGIVSCGIGNKVGDGLVIAWKDPSPIQDAKYVSFTTWDNTVVFRNVTVQSDDSEMMDGIEYSDYMPSYLQTYEEERAKARTRAERFGVGYVDPSMNRMEELLSPEERERVRKVMHGEREGGFITGFDPTTEEERKKAEARAKRFGIQKKTDEEIQKEKDAEFASREKREQRAARFEMPVVEDMSKAKRVESVLKKMRVPRKDPDPEDQKRMDTIHVYGAFDGVYTRDILKWFEEYGPSHIEWLHDCAANIVFEDEITAKRAITGIGAMIPDIESTEESTEEQDDAMEDEPKQDNSPKLLREKGWMHGILNGKAMLIRTATVTDIKADSSSGYRTKIGYRGRRRARRGGHRNQTDEPTVPTVLGTKRNRDDENDVEMEDVSSKKQKE